MTADQTPGEAAQTSPTSAPAEATSDAGLCNDAAPENGETEPDSNSASGSDEPSSDGSEEAEADHAAGDRTAEPSTIADAAQTTNSEAAASAIENANTPDVLSSNPSEGRSEIPTDEAAAERCAVIEAPVTPVGTDVAAVPRGALLGESGTDMRITKAELSDLAARHAVGEVSDPAARLPVVESEVPYKVLEKLYPSAQAAMRTLCRRPPIVAGQDPALYFDLLEVAVDEWRPQSVLECSLVKQIVDAEWELLTFQDVQQLGHYRGKNSRLEHC